MKSMLVAMIVLLSLGAGASFADEPPPAPVTAPPPAPPPPDAPSQPRNHVDTAVVGDTQPDGAGAPTGDSGLENDHNFQAGAPETLGITKQLHLSPKQQAALNQVIEQSDAGAAALIKREHDVRDMIKATTPEDPMYAKLIADQSAAADRWTENRDTFRRNVMDVLTPAQRTRFEALQSQSDPKSSP